MTSIVIKAAKFVGTFAVTLAIGEVARRGFEAAVDATADEASLLYNEICPVVEVKDRWYKKPRKQRYNRITKKYKNI